MVAPLPTGVSQAELDEIYSRTAALARTESRRWAWDHSPLYLLPNLGISLGILPGPAPALPTGVDTAEYNTILSNLISAADTHQLKLINSNWPGYLQANLADELAANPPPSIGGTTFNFMLAMMPAGATLTRASTGTFRDVSGVLQTAAIDAARFTYDITTHALRGLLDEPQSTNGIRNGNATGAVSASPGTAPTNWTISANVFSLTRTITAGVTENGVPCIDIRWAGTPSGTSNLSIQTEANTQIAAAPNDKWTGSFFAKLQAGSLSGLTFVDFHNQARNSGGTAVTPTTPMAYTLTGTMQRFSETVTCVDATTAFISQNFRFGVANGVPIDFTIRIGGIQLEKQPAQTSYIPTTGAAAVTRSPDLVPLAVTNGTYDVTITRESGNTVLPGTVVSGGSFTVPSDPSPLQSVQFI